MRHFFNSFTKIDYILLIALSIGFCVLVSQYYPISGDDFRYRFHYGDGSKLTSVVDIIDSNANQYMFHTGRFAVHCFVQYFLSYGGFTIFYIISTFMFALLLLSLTYLARYELCKHKYDILLIFLGIICLVPLLGTLCWGTIAMTVNYMYSAAIYFFFLCIYLHIKTDQIKYNWWKNIFLFLFALFCGAWQESFAIGIAGALFLYHIITIKETKGSLLVLLIGFGLGVLILIGAPGNFVRAEEDSGIVTKAVLLWQLKHVFLSKFYVLSWLYLGLISVAVDFILYRRLAFVKNNWPIFFLGLIVSLVTLLMAVLDMYQGPWQSTIQGVIGCILLVRIVDVYLLDGLSRKKYVESVLVGLLLSLSAWIVGETAYYRIFLKQQTMEFETTITENCSNEYYDGQMRAVIMNNLPFGFLFDLVCPIYHTWPYDYLLPKMNKFYGLDCEEMESGSFLPESQDSIMARCVKENQLAEYIYATPLPYVVIRLDSSKNTSNTYLTLSTYPKSKIKQLLYQIRGKKSLDRRLKLSKMPSLQREGLNYYVAYEDWFLFYGRTIITSSLNE